MQLVRLLAGRLAVVARHVELERRAEADVLDAARRAASTARVTAVALAPLRLATAIVTAGSDAPRLRFVRHVRRRLAEAVGDVGDVPQVYRRATARADDDAADFGRRRDGRTDVDLVDLSAG